MTTTYQKNRRNNNNNQKQQQQQQSKRPTVINEATLLTQEQQVLASLQYFLGNNNTTVAFETLSVTVDCLAAWAQMGDGTQATRLCYQLFHLTDILDDTRSTNNGVFGTGDDGSTTNTTAIVGHSTLPTTTEQLQRLRLQQEEQNASFLCWLPPHWQMQAARYVLQAWCQQIQNRALQQQQQQQQQQGRHQNQTRSLHNALATLTWMEQIIQHQPQSSNSGDMLPPPPPLRLRAQDYRAVVQAAVDVGELSMATDVLCNQWQQKEARQQQQVDAPPTRRDYLRLMRSWSNLLHYEKDVYRNRRQSDLQNPKTIFTPYTIASQITRLGQSFQSLQSKSSKNEDSLSVMDDLDLHNIMLDAWSKVLPKVAASFSPSKQPSPPQQQQPSSLPFLAVGKGNSDDNTSLLLAQDVQRQATTLWQHVRSLDVSNTNNGKARMLKAKSFTLMLYIYCKCHQPELAWQTWTDLVSFLLESPPPQVQDSVDSDARPVRRQAPQQFQDRIDSRSFRTLVQCVVQHIQELEMTKNNKKNDDEDTTIVLQQQQQRKWAERTRTILDDMWKLDEVGYVDVAPDVYLYTTVVTAWTLVKPDGDDKDALSYLHPAQLLLQDLEDRYRTSSSPEQQQKLQPDVALYNAVLQAMVVSSAGHSHHNVERLAAIEAAGSFVKQIMEIKSLQNPKVAPDTITYNILLDCCTKVAVMDGNNNRNDDSNNDIATIGLRRAEQTLSWMVQEFQKGNKRVKPNFHSFSVVIQGFLNNGDTDKAEEWLDRMEERYIPPAKLFQSLIKTCCQSVDGRHFATAANKDDLDSSDLQRYQQQKQNLLRAQRILIRMEELYRATGTLDLLPDQSFYDLVLQAWSNIGEDNATAERLENLRRSKDRLNSLVPAFSPGEEERQFVSSSVPFSSPEQVIGLLQNPDERQLSTMGFNKVIKQMAEGSCDGKLLTGQRAEEILDYMIVLHLANGDEAQQIKPDMISFNTVILAWAKSSHPQAAMRAEAVLQKLNKLQESGLLLGVKPDRITYNTIVHAYAKTGAAREAERVFRMLEMLHQTSNDDRYQPDVVTYSTLLNAWANTNSDQKRAANHAEQVLLRMHEAHKANPSACPAPNTECFNEVLYAWARSTDQNAAKRAEMVMRLMEDMSKASGNDMVKPTTRSYNIVLYALAKSHDGDIDAPFRAQMLLEKMKKAGRSGESWMRPDHVSYTTVISAWCRLGGRQALDATERLVKEACASRSGIIVDDQFFANVIYSLARSGEKGAAQKAESIVNRMKTLNYKLQQFPVAPTTKVYNALLHCWAKSGERDAGARAEAVLRSMEFEVSKGRLKTKPDVYSFTSVLDALSKSRDAFAWKRAEDIIETMELLGREDTSILPNAHAYTALIHNYARSRDVPRKALRAQSVLDRAKKSLADGHEESRPTIICYNAVLNACEYVPLSTSNSDDWQEAFRVACLTWNEVRTSSYLYPTHVTYGSFLGVIARLMPKSDIRNNMTELVFKRCCNDGQVASIVMNKLKAASPVLYNKVMKSTENSNLPSEWSCNVNH